MKGLVIILSLLWACAGFALPPEELKQTIKNLGHDSSRTRDEAEATLTKHAREHLPQLQVYRDHEDPEIQIRIRRILGSVKAKPAPKVAKKPTPKLRKINFQQIGILEGALKKETMRLDKLAEETKQAQARLETLERIPGSSDDIQTAQKLADHLAKRLQSQERIVVRQKNLLMELRSATTRLPEDE